MTDGVWTVREAGLSCRWYVSLTPARDRCSSSAPSYAARGPRPGSARISLGQRLGYSGAQVGKVETGERAPAQDFAEACDQAFPDAGGLFGRIYQLARRWDGGYPSWFAEWIDSERRATSLRWWEPLLIPGLLQTADYARAILAADPETTEDQLGELVAARLERQAILDKPVPPTLWVLLDEAVLHRLIGSRKIMYDQLLELADASCRSNITVQIVPAEVGAHAGLLGAFIVAGFDNCTGYRVHGVTRPGADHRAAVRGQEALAHLRHVES